MHEGIVNDKGKDKELEINERTLCRALGFHPYSSSAKIQTQFLGFFSYQQRCSVCLMEIVVGDGFIINLDDT